MAEIRIESDSLVVEVRGLDKLWALRSRLEIPLAHVRGATADPGVRRDGAGVKLGGARVPGVLTAGTFRQDGDRVFWDVHDASRAVVVELRDETYRRLVVEVDEPRSVADRINAAVG